MPLEGGGNSSTPNTLSTFVPLLGVQWRPRDGRNSEFMLWDDALQRVREELGLTAAIMGVVPPTLQSLGAYEPFGVGRTKEMKADLQLALAEYQRLNTLLYRILRPSLLLGGAHLEQDLERMRG